LLDADLEVCPVLECDCLLDLVFEVLVVSGAAERQVSSFGADAEREARLFQQVF
jgi:hypothetical protein